MCSITNIPIGTINMTVFAEAVMEWIHEQITNGEYEKIWVELETLSQFVYKMAARNGLTVSYLDSVAWEHHYRKHVSDAMVDAAHNCLTQKKITDDIGNVMFEKAVDPAAPANDGDDVPFYPNMNRFKMYNSSLANMRRASADLHKLCENHRKTMSKDTSAVGQQHRKFPMGVVEYVMRRADPTNANVRF